MTKHYELEQINPSLLILDERYQSRQTQLIKDTVARAASDNSRQRQLAEIATSLENGNGIKEPIEAYDLYGKLYVVSGFHRTEACHTFLKNNPGKSLLVPVKIYRGYSETEAYLDSLTKNEEHGTALDKSEKMQNRFKQSLLQGENLETVSKRQTAKLFNCSPSQGLNIIRAQAACIETGLPSVSDWMDDYQKAATKLKKKLLSRYEALTSDDFDKDGFPIIRRLADAYEGKDIKDDLSNDELELKEVVRQVTKIEELLSKNPTAFRKALNRLDKKALGIVVKREWDEGAIVLKYNDSEGKDVNGQKF